MNIDDDMVQLAASIFDTPMAMISLIDGQRQWFKARVGIDIKETSREHAFCARAIQTLEEVMVVNNAAEHPEHRNNALVMDGPRIRFYAGAPLITANGFAIGTVCVMDTEPRTAEPRRIAALKLLAKQVIEKMERNRHGCLKNAACQAFRSIFYFLINMQTQNNKGNICKSRQ